MVTRPRKKCEHAGCQKIASFSLRNDRKARRCSEHKQPGMVARYYKQCRCLYREEDIQLLQMRNEWLNHRIRYNKPGKEPRFCFMCKRRGMVDLIGDGEPEDEEVADYDDHRWLSYENCHRFEPTAESLGVGKRARKGFMRIYEQVRNGQAMEKKQIPGCLPGETYGMIRRRYINLHLPKYVAYPTLRKWLGLVMHACRPKGDRPLA